MTWLLYTLANQRTNVKSAPNRTLIYISASRRLDLEKLLIQTQLYTTQYTIARSDFEIALASIFMSLSNRIFPLNEWCVSGVESRSRSTEKDTKLISIHFHSLFAHRFMPSVYEEIADIHNCKILTVVCIDITWS